MDAFRLDGKTALVTGASGGLGLHFAHLLAAQGARVVLAARRAVELDLAVAAIRARGGQAQAVTLDVTDEGSVAQVLGHGPVPDVVINNAGIARGGAAIDLQAADWQAVIDTNLSGVFHVAQGAARAMRAAGKGGSIVNVASILGHRVTGGVAAYAAAKAGVVQLTAALALEWARFGIRVNALSPGYIATEINRDFFASDAGQALIRRIPQRRLGKPEDLDGALMLLASDAGRYMTGTSLAVDGGHLVSGL